MIDNIYNQKILEYAMNLPENNLLSDAEFYGAARSKLCGSEMKISFNSAQNKISTYGHEVKACALGQACASVVSNKIHLVTLTQIEEAAKMMEDLLNGRSFEFLPLFDDLKYFEPIKASP